jgi:hypothetical protein
LPVCIAESRVDAVQLVKIDALDAKITQATFGTLTESACPPLALQQDHYDPVVQLFALYRECESCAGSLRRKSSVRPFDEEMPAALSPDGIHQLTVNPHETIITPSKLNICRPARERLGNRQETPPPATRQRSSRRKHSSCCRNKIRPSR